ncbi:hypothetical protein Tco_0557945 [Tanacetum coccineum]
MSDLKFADTHKLVVFLEKPTESEGFEEIVDFLNTNHIKYALTVNPTIYCSCIKQFWDTVKAKTVNRKVQLQALVDKKKVIITESTIRRDLQLEDANGVDCLPNAATFEQLTLMGKSKKRKTKVPQSSGSTDNIPDESVPTTSNYPLLSGEDRLRLTELMDLCTNLQKKVLDLEKAKTTQDSEISSLKKKVKKLERWNKSRTPGLKRLRKVGLARRVESYDEASLGDQEDVSKQGREIADIDADTEVTLIDETQERNDDNLMFDTDVLDEQEVKVEKVVSTVEVTTKSATTTTVDELTLGQTLIEIKATKPKVIEVMIQEPSKFTTTTTTTTPVASKPSHDKGKAKMIESEEPLKMKPKDQVLFDEQEAIRLKAQFDEEERITREKEEANAALTAQWNDIQDKVETDYELAQRMQVEEQEELTIEEKVNTFVDMDTELVKGSEIREEESSSKRVEEDVTIDAIPLATKPAPIVNFQIHRKGRNRYYEIMRADGSAKTYLLFSQLLKEFDREDLENL